LRDLDFVSFFFFQAEDGIRDLTVTGVQTCALPIFCETLRRSCEYFCPKARESRRREAPHFLRRVRRSPTYRRECRPAFALWIKANRVPGVSIESEHREQVTMCEQQSRPPNALHRPRLR